MTEKQGVVWSDVDFDLWYNEVVFMFMKNKQGVPNREHCRWHWVCGFGPAQTYYKMVVDKSWEEDSDDGSANGPAGSKQSR